MTHRWNLEHRIPGCETLENVDRTEKTCPFCGLIKITVHPPQGYPYRLWRTKDGQHFSGNNVPHPCTAARQAATEMQEVPI